MQLNPYEPNASAQETHKLPDHDADGGSSLITFVAVTLFPAIYEAALYWGTREWMFWRSDLKLCLLLWWFGFLFNLVLYCIARLIGFRTNITRRLVLIVLIPTLVAFAISWRFAFNPGYRELPVSVVVLVAQLIALFTVRSSFVGKLLLGIACISGLVLYVLHIGIESMAT